VVAQQTLLKTLLAVHKKLISEITLAKTWLENDTSDLRQLYGVGGAFSDCQIG
jgi:hypothetical protein